MNLQQSVQELSPENTQLQVFHRYLKIPLKNYLDTVEDFLDPWDEQAYQFFVSRYLEELGDKGIVGMVRQNKDDQYVYLDAAVRYPVNS